MCYRCLVIARPMSYSSSQRSVFFAISAICNTVIAAAFTILPFALQKTGVWAYKALEEVPLCIFEPNTESGKLLLFLDAMVSFGLTWMLVFLSSAGKNDALIC